MGNKNWYKSSFWQPTSRKTTYGRGYTSSSIGFGNYSSDWSSKWFSKTASREKIKPTLSWINREYLETRLSIVLSSYLRTLVRSGAYAKSNLGAFLHSSLSNLSTVIDDRLNRYEKLDYVILYDLFKIHYYSLKTLNITDRDSAHTRLVLKHIDPYNDSGGDYTLLSRKQAATKASVDFLRIVLYLLQQKDDGKAMGLGHDELEELLKNMTAGKSNSELNKVMEEMEKNAMGGGGLDQFENDLDVTETKESHVSSLEEAMKDIKNANKQIGLDSRQSKDLENKLEVDMKNNAGNSNEVRKSLEQKIEETKLNSKNLSSLVNSLEESMEKNGNITIRREVYSIFDADELDALLHIENLSPVLRQIMLYDPEVEETIKQGTVDIYLDISSSMANIELEAGKSIVLQLKDEGYLANIYAFNNTVYTILDNIHFLPYIRPGGGTSFHNVYHEINKRKKTSIIYTDGGSSLSHYDPNVYFIGCRGSRFSGVDDQYHSKGQILFYNADTGNFTKSSSSVSSYQRAFG